MGGGKPAARQGDMTRKGLDIVQGSAGVLIGAPTGVACSVCPGGITYANPVNPVLGAKVLPGETDLALPCPLPFILFRAYSSYRTRTPAPVGVFGPGWKAPFDIRLQIRDEGLILNDSGGRSIHFEPLFPGEISYSRSESLWLARGGVARCRLFFSAPTAATGPEHPRRWGCLVPAGQGVLIRKASTRITSARSMKCMTTPDVSRVPTGRTLPAGRWTAGETTQKWRAEQAVRRRYGRDGELC
ncbi:rhs core protein with extension [Shigella sonnei]|nr:rhs core protein with extension [Shigella sonnei]